MAMLDGRPIRKFHVEEIRELLKPGTAMVPIIGGVPELAAEAQFVDAPKVELAPASALREGRLDDLFAGVFSQSEEPELFASQALTLIVHGTRPAVFHLPSFTIDLKWEYTRRLDSFDRWVEWTARGLAKYR
jgi:hypothetical protein